MGCAGVGMPLVHLELVGRGGLGRRLLDGLRELEVVVVDLLLRLVLLLGRRCRRGLADARSR